MPGAAAHLLMLHSAFIYSILIKKRDVNLNNTSYELRQQNAIESP